MKISKMFKRIASMGMALAMAMSCAAVSAGAISTTDDPNVIADAYVKAKVHNLIKLDAHLTDTKVPPTHAPEVKNAWLDEENKTVTIEFVNPIFAVQSINTDSEEVNEDGESCATITDTQMTADTVRGGDYQRVQYVTVAFEDYDTEYTFGSTEYVNKHAYTVLMGQAGKTKNFDITIKVNAPQ